MWRSAAAAVVALLALAPLPGAQAPASGLAAPVEVVAPPATDPLASPEARGAVLFSRQCIACHGLGVRRTFGPDLAGVTSRRSRAWLDAFLADPIAAARTDEVARALRTEWGGRQMPPPGLSAEEREAVLAFLAASAGAIEAAAGPAPDRRSISAMPGLYAARCAGCHGVAREGGIGPALEPARLRRLGRREVRLRLQDGSPSGMPAWGRDGLLSPRELDAMAAWLERGST